jgi:5-methylcytosine-specific restriction enzyme B
MAHVKLHRKEYHLEKEDILTALKGVHPLPSHDFTINIHGKDYPIKQAISAATGLSSEKFSGSEAHEFLRKLGFVIENYDQRHRRLQKRKHTHF